MLDWNKAIKDASVTIGTVEICPRVTFEVRAFTGDRYNPTTGKYEKGKVCYSVGYNLDGNTSGVSPLSRKQVEAYIEYQKTLIPQYENLIAKRKRISERIAPLNRKWFKYAEDLHKLGKGQ